MRRVLNSKIRHGVFSKQKLLYSAFVLAAMSVAAVPAGATNLLGSTTSATISGTTFGFSGAAMPWTAEVYSLPNSCLRIAVTARPPIWRRWWLRPTERSIATMTAGLGRSRW